MQLKHPYYYRCSVVMGLSVLVFVIFDKNYASFAIPFYIQPQTISVNDPRPLWAAIAILQDRHGVVITYEDAPYIHETEVVDNTAPAFRQAHPNGPRALDPIGGSLEISYNVSPGPVKLDEIRAVIQGLLDQHAQKNNPGRFRLVEEAGMFHVVPTQVRDSAGKMVSVASILDTTISFPEQERPAFTTLELIASAIGRPRGGEIIIGSAPLNVLYRSTIRQGAKNERARDVLIKTLKAVTKSKVSWMIFYGPGRRGYALNLYARFAK